MNLSMPERLFIGGSLAITGIAVFLAMLPVGHPSLDPAPGPYTWSRINPEPNLTCLVVETSYNTHSIAMYCQEIEHATMDNAR